jgi:hypothetical protein
MYHFGWMSELWQRWFRWWDRAKKLWPAPWNRDERVGFLDEMKTEHEAKLNKIINTCLGLIDTDAGDGYTMARVWLSLSFRTLKFRVWAIGVEGDIDAVHSGV